MISTSLQRSVVGPIINSTESYVADKVEEPLLEEKG